MAKKTKKVATRSGAFGRRDFLKTGAAGAAYLALPRLSTGATVPMSGAEIDQRARELVGQMTLHEKVGQMSGHIMDGGFKHVQGYGKTATFNTRKIGAGRG